MLPLSEIEKQYPPGLHAYKRFMLREYLHIKYCKLYMTVQLAASWH